MFHLIKSKLKPQVLTGPQDKERVNNACSATISALEAALRIVKDAAGLAPVPGLQAGISGLICILGIVRKTLQNAEEVDKLKTQIEALTATLENLGNKKKISPAVIDRIGRLASTWEKLSLELKRIDSRSITRTFLKCDSDAQAISGHIQTIGHSIQIFIMETTVATEASIDEVGERVENLQKTVDSIEQHLNGQINVKDPLPPYAALCQFDADKERVACCDGTRTDVLNRINLWIHVQSVRRGGDLVSKKQSDNANVGADDRFIFWINASAGTGKTTIAYTIAEDCRARGILGASFFCSRDNADCNDPRLIFISIAYQLRQSNALYAAEVTRTLQLNPDIRYSSVSNQLEQLLVKPLRKFRDSFPPRIVVLDALDECRDSGTTSTILSSLILHVDKLSPLKFLVTSRPEVSITTPFKLRALKNVTEQLILHEFVVHNDIKRYLSSKLTLTRQCYGLEETWPLEKDILALVKLSHDLFIFAATSVKFIEDRNYSNPKAQLANLLCNTATIENSSPHHHLYQLYTQVLSHAFPDISPKLSQTLKKVLGTIILLRDPLSSLALERLLGLESGTVWQTLLHLHSVVIVPLPEDDGGVIRLLHPSFFDYITDPTRCLRPDFIINVRSQNTHVARSCLDVMMKKLKRDVCGIKNPSVFNSEVEDLPMRIETHIPPELRYACRHWAWHLSNGTVPDLLETLKEFCSKFLLYWLEVCALLGELRNALVSLDVAQKALFKAGCTTTKSFLLLHDCERFALEFCFVIGPSSLQLYHSALAFTPRDTLIWKTYGTEFHAPVKVYNSFSNTWDLCILPMQGHTDHVNSVAFSRDGIRIASGSADRTVRLWDAVGGVLLNTLEEHTSCVKSVAFSPDGTRIISGSDDTTLRLWDVLSGVRLNVLEGHTSGVNSTAFSPCGTWIVSGSSDTTLRLWDAKRVLHLNTLKGHTSGVNSVAFSPNGKCIASGSDDGTLRLWDRHSGAPLNTLKGHASVNSVAFSPDGQLIVSGSTDCTIRLWESDDPVSSVPLKTFKGHTCCVNSVTFSPDGTRIVSGSNDRTLRLWSTISGAHLDTLKRHTDAVYSVAFSPDGKRILSGSIDNNLRIWDADGSPHVDTFEQHADSVCSIAISQDGTRIVSGSNDKTLRVWDAVGGACLETLRGHTGIINSVKFSPDGTHIVSVSADNTFRIWDTDSGAHLPTLEGHTHDVHSMALSINPRLTASASHQILSITDDGWIYSTTLQRRVCWIPVSCRPYGSAISSNGNMTVMGTYGGRVVILDFTGMDSYLRGL